MRDRQMLHAWASPRAAAVARMLLLAAAALVFLDAAATFRVVYTLRISYVLCVVACIVGFPFVVRGWARMPSAVRWSAAFLVGAYLVAAVVARPMTLPGQPRTGEYRIAVYVADLAVGLATFGVTVGVFRSPAELRRLLWAFVAGLAAASIYGVYQWFAQQYGLPLASVNNTLDSNGITSGAFQGSGVLRWERVRGTFLEPHFFGAYLAALLPLAIVAVVLCPRRARPIASGVAVLAAGALVLTASAPDEAIFGSVLVVGAVVAIVTQGRVRAAALAGGFAALVLIAGAYTMKSPSLLASATGRSSAELTTTTSFRTETWARVAEIWAHRPVVGWGPGQSSVQLAAETDLPPGLRPAVPGALQSAQGAWAASLVDAGILGFAGSILFILSVLVTIVARAASQRSVLALGAAAAAVAAVAGAEIGGDRLELQTWLVLGFALAVALAQGGGAGEKRSTSDDGAH